MSGLESQVIMEAYAYKPTVPPIQPFFYCGIDVHKREITAAIYGRDIFHYYIK